MFLAKNSALKMVPLAKRSASRLQLFFSIRGILGDKRKLPLEPASGDTVLIIEDERVVVHLLTFNLRRAVQPGPSVEPKSDNKQHRDNVPSHVLHRSQFVGFGSTNYREKASIVYGGKFSGFRPRHVARSVPEADRRYESNRVLR